MKELLQRLKVAKLTELTPFEALLHVKIADGVPAMTDLVSVRNRSHLSAILDLSAMATDHAPKELR